MESPIIKIRQSLHRLEYKMGVHVSGKSILLLNQGFIFTLNENHTSVINKTPSDCVVKDYWASLPGRDKL